MQAVITVGVDSMLRTALKIFKRNAADSPRLMITQTHSDEPSKSENDEEM
jgi:hypothetical protein